MTSSIPARLALIVLFAALPLAGCGAPPAAHTDATAAAQEQNRPGYMIVIGRGVDSPRMGPYARATIPLLLEYGGELLFISEEGAAEVLEGGPFQSSIRVFRFPSLQHARDFYYSDRYQQEAIPLREGLGQLDVIVSDAFVPDPRWQAAP
jgi:uncharacterized protein (DUF1330 family)